jgi:hypothetical protein
MVITKPTEGVAGRSSWPHLHPAIVLLAVANAVQSGIIGDDDSVTGGVAGASALFVLNGALAVALFRRPKLRRLAEGWHER